MKSAKIILAALILLSLLIPSHSAHADISPPPAPQLGGLEPFGYQETNVQMVYERVEMEIQPLVQFDYEYTDTLSWVYVTAYFTMHNLGSISESMQVIFPLQSFTHCRAGAGGGNSNTHYFVNEDSFEVVVNGYSVPIQKITTDHPYKIEGLCDQMTWAGFDVTFPAGEDVVIKVQYVMESLAIDLMQNIEYILETGAGWAGPIQRGYVIVKFPYTATTENVLPESTPGYQFLYNEIFWSFENLEPTYENNIQVSIVSPDTWQKILSIKRDLKENPRLSEKWLELAETYFGIATWHYDNIRSDAYFQRISSVYEAGIAANPDNAELYAKYAEYKLYRWSPHVEGQIPENEAAQVLFLLNKALALEPGNETANEVSLNLLIAAPFITFTPPATIPPTATSLFTVTPSATPTATATFSQESPDQSVIVTAVQTELVTRPTSTLAPIATSSPTQVAVQNENQNGTGTPLMIFGALVLFIAGIGAGTFWSKRMGK